MSSGPVFPVMIIFRQIIDIMLFERTLDVPVRASAYRDAKLPGRVDNVFDRFAHEPSLTLNR